MPESAVEVARVAMMRLYAFLLLTQLATCKGGGSVHDIFDGTFQQIVDPLVKGYIFDNYGQFAASQLTFRSLKTHLAAHTDYTYEQLSEDSRSEIIEEVTDEIANNCNMGEVELEECKKRIGYQVPSKTSPDEL